MYYTYVFNYLGIGTLSRTKKFTGAQKIPP